jgi:hypothetical protein
VSWAAECRLRIGLLLRYHTEASLRIFDQKEVLQLLVTHQLGKAQPLPFIQVHISKSVSGLKKHLGSSEKY